MRLALLLAFLLLQGGLYRVYLPFVSREVVPAKGVAGSITEWQAMTLNTTWSHHWSLDAGSAVDVSKGHWAWEEYGEGPDEIAAEMESCTSGWFMFGDEWEYQDAAYCGAYPEWCWPMSRQIAEARWYIEKRAEINPGCHLAFGGILTFHPYAGGVIAADWVPEFYDAYSVEYGESPNIDAIVFDDYYWPEFWYEQLGAGAETWEDVTLLSVNAARDVYGPDIEIWAREVGSLWAFDHRWAVAAMDQLDTVARHYDRIAWFISRGWNDGWGFTSLLNQDGSLTDLGEMYRGFECR